MFCFEEKPFCYLWIDKKIKEPYILFVDGNKIVHPDLEVGNRSRMKILRVNPKIDLNAELIKILISEAVKIINKD